MNNIRLREIAQSAADGSGANAFFTEAKQADDARRLKQAEEAARNNPAPPPAVEDNWWNNEGWGSPVFLPFLSPGCCL